ncbi:ABC transporter permease [Aliikangiella sp. G2MR2-5]|uniref:ABC transporter permease n=1 Tax=Aliikangiella sp. G2MR2-5 TaxID=2788943 RepID=UPI0018AAA570|nr:ABC transporter permease [Aliikangiella sp. G2MR2-5]
MLKNYIMVAWKVFLRRKFFTFVNLFGISITLTVVMLALTLLNGYIYPSGPEKNASNFVTFERLTLTNDDHSNTNSGRPGFRFLNNNINLLKLPELVSYATVVQHTNTFKENKKFSYKTRYTDANYWKVLDFNFIQGRPFNDEEIERGDMAVVIDLNTALSHFKDAASALGKNLMLGEQQFTIIGIVDNVSAIENIAFANAWLPYTTMTSTAYQLHEMDNWLAILYHSDSNKITAIQQEFVDQLKNNLQISRRHDYSEAYAGAYTKLEAVASDMFAGTYEYEYKSGVGILITLLTVFTLVFMTLPSINMININISRIYERASEIGVRKAFGASSNQLISQFVIENMLLTLIGGLVAMTLTYLIIQAIELSGILPFLDIAFNFRFFAWGLLAIVVMSLLSGTYPAIKMSRLNPALSLKGGN